MPAALDHPVLGGVAAAPGDRCRARGGRVPPFHPDEDLGLGQRRQGRLGGDLDRGTRPGPIAPLGQANPRGRDRRLVTTGPAGGSRPAVPGPAVPGPAPASAGGARTGTGKRSPRAAISTAVSVISTGSRPCILCHFDPPDGWTVRSSAGALAAAEAGSGYRFFLRGWSAMEIPVTITAESSPPRDVVVQCDSNSTVAQLANALDVYSRGFWLAPPRSPSARLVDLGLTAGARLTVAATPPAERPAPPLRSRWWSSAAWPRAPPSPFPQGGGHHRAGRQLQRHPPQRAGVEAARQAHRRRQRRRVLEDLDSANGTSVNAAPVTASTPVQETDLIGLGSTIVALSAIPAPSGRARSSQRRAPALQQAAPRDPHARGADHRHARQAPGADGPALPPSAPP